MDPFFDIFSVAGRSINLALVFSQLSCAYTDVCLSVWSAKTRRGRNGLK